ncbi:MAG: hypothetical protein ACE5NC_01985 [Anaerolineae bacterium]
MKTGSEPAGDTLERVNRVLADLGADCRAGYRHGSEYYIRCRTPEGLVRVGYLSQKRLAGDEAELRRTLQEVVGDLMPPEWTSGAGPSRIRSAS